MSWWRRRRVCIVERGQNAPELKCVGVQYEGFDSVRVACLLHLEYE